MNNKPLNNLRNYLDTDNYMIGNNLHTSLEQGRLHNEENIDDVLYVVMFRVLNHKDKVLVYNYISYPKIFYPTLIYFLALRSSILGNTFKEPGNFSSIFDLELDGVTTNVDALEIAKRLTNIEKLISNVSLSPVPVSLEQIFRLINKLIIEVNVQTMADLIDLAFLKNYKLFIEEFFYSLKDFDKLKNIINYEDPKDFNILNSCLFIVDKLNTLVESTRYRGYDVNGGTKSSRAQVSSVASFLSILDQEYRQSLYNHNNYHVTTRGNLDTKFKLTRDKFSFNNIHLNVGKNRWASTLSKSKLREDVNKKDSKLNKNSYLNKNELLQGCYQQVNEILEDRNTISLEQLQLKIEDILFEENTLFDNTNTNKYNNIIYNATTHNYIIEAKSKITKSLSNMKNFEKNAKSYGTEYIPWFNKIISILGIDIICNMLIQYFLYIITNESISNNNTYTPGIPSLTSYQQFGRKVVNRYFYEKYLKVKSNDIMFTEFIDNDIEYKELAKISNFNARVGGFFIYALINTKLIVLNLENRFDDGVAHKEYVRLTQKSREIMVVNEDQKIFTLPSKLPMICPPKKYSLSNGNITYGGYLLNGVKYTNDIFIDKVGYGKSTVITDENIIIDLINGLSNTPYKINVETLNFINEYGIDKGIIIDANNDNIKEILADPYKFSTKRVSKDRRALISKLYLQENILNIAQLYSKLDNIYFPVRMDQRTRIYCVTDYFDYQKNDLAKGLISFATPGKIYKTDSSVVKYFKAFGANMYGNNLDKKSINYRVDWIDNNSDKILNFEKNDIVDKSENKPCFTSFCFEYKRFIEFMKDNESKVFYTYLPIQLDASCNGYQHLTLLTREKKLFNVLNLASSSHDDDPDDFYNYILNLTKTYIKSQINILSQTVDKSDKITNSISSYEKLLNIVFDRSMVKKTIMTKSYNATIPTQVKQLLSFFDEKGDDKNKYHIHHSNENIKFKREDIVALVLAIKVVIAKESPRINELSKYLDSIVSICTKLNFPVPWVLPSGAVIRESYEKEKSDEIKAFFFVNTKYTFKSYQRDKYDLKKQKRATMPNLIHSLDATTIAILYNNFKAVGSLYTIHDCFGVTANNVPRLISKLKLAYVQLYSSTGYLKEFDEFVKINLNKTFKDDVYKLNDSFIYIPDKSKKIRKYSMPDIKNVLDKSVDVNGIKKSVNIVI